MNGAEEPNGIEEPNGVAEKERRDITSPTAAKTATNNTLVLLLSYQPPSNIVNIRLAVITLLAIVLPLHNHWQLFGAHHISLVTAFLGLEGQYILAAYSLGWLVACTKNKQLNHSTLITTLATLLHLPTTMIALVYCLVTLMIQIVTDFFWYLFIATCTISLDILIL